MGGEPTVEGTAAAHDPAQETEIGDRLADGGVHTGAIVQIALELLGYPVTRVGADGIAQHTGCFPRTRAAHARGTAGS